MSMGVIAQEQTDEVEIFSIGHYMGNYTMWVKHDVMCYEVTLFTHDSISDMLDEYFINRNIDDDIQKLLENALVGRKVEIKIEDFDNKSIFDDVIVSWKILPTENEHPKTINKKYVMNYSVYNILKNYGDPELFKVVNIFFEEQKVSDKNKPEFYDIGQTIESGAIELMFKQELDFPVNFIYKKDSYSFDVIPTKETGYIWTYSQCREVENLIESRNLMDKFAYILDYRSAGMNRYGIMDVKKIKDAQFANEPNVKANWNDILGH